ncbi:MAG: DUF871 domain-containing protein [Hungatella sp.]|nr:DUF871 domain-containing protein [Hungatella sp.]
MVRLGVSVYPEQETLKDIDTYLATASKYGFTKVFTSMFSVEGTKEEIISYFKNFTKIAHKYNMEVSGDCNGDFFKKMEATETDLSVFKEMGIDTIRMDFSFNDKRDAVLINNKDGIKIEMSTAFINIIEAAIANGADTHNLFTCHNFYPEKYTAPSLEAINQLNNYWHSKGIPVAIFISSLVEGSHGPWPVSDGLPTIEEHRNWPIEVQLKHCLALDNIDEILIGNAFASEKEFEAIDKVMKEAFIHIPLNPSFGSMADFIPHGDIKRIPFSIKLEEGITDLEKEILFQFSTHSDMGDCLNYMLRSRWTRVIYKGKSIPVRPCNKTHYTRGDVVIVNDNLAHYRAEIQIVLKDIPVDGQRNLLGHISEEEICFLDSIKGGDVFSFME